MSPQKLKNLFAIITVLLVLGAAEIAARVAFPRIFRHPEKSLALLRGENLRSSRRVIGQPYLNYALAPDFKDGDGSQHNAHGQRGPLVPMERQPGTLRVLCLGGSTTYGWSVRRPDEAYPGQLQALLAAKPPPGYSEVEVINAGLPWGTSAELLTHYHFKFHYYRPDWVVLHVGINDAQAIDADNFHPDYSHWRKHIEQVRPLPPGLRWLSHSRLLDLALVPLLVGMDPERASFNRMRGARPETEWFKAPPATAPGISAFSHNLSALLEMIRQDGARAVVMPEQWNPALLKDPRRQEQYRLSTGNSVRVTAKLTPLMERVARDKGALFITFPPEIKAASWADEAHLDGAGNKAKAEHVAAHLRRALKASQEKAAAAP